MPDNLERLKAARHKVAQLVIADRVYWPIFKRLESEITMLEVENDLLARARALVQLHSATG